MSCASLEPYTLSGEWGQHAIQAEVQLRRWAAPWSCCNFARCCIADQPCARPAQHQLAGSQLSCACKSTVSRGAGRGTPVDTASSEQEGIVVIGHHAIYQALSIQPGTLSLCLPGGNDVGQAEQLQQLLPARKPGLLACTCTLHGAALGKSVSSARYRSWQSCMCHMWTWRLQWLWAWCGMVAADLYDRLYGTCTRSQDAGLMSCSLDDICNPITSGMQSAMRSSWEDTWQSPYMSCVGASVWPA